MSLVISHNLPALQAYNAVSATTYALEKNMRKLSTGLRINSAADDAAGLAISEKMRAQIRGLDRAAMNSQDGVSMIQTAEGALNEVHAILQRMRELAVQSANDTLTQQDRAYIQLEIDQLREEITRIGNTTQFNKKKLLDGSAGTIWSSDSLTTLAIIHGGLRTIDQFGQKGSAERNYKITVEAAPGQGEALKTNILKVKHDGPDLTSSSITKVYGTPWTSMSVDEALGYNLGYSIADSVTGGSAFTQAQISSSSIAGDIVIYDLEVVAVSASPGDYSANVGLNVLISAKFTRPDGTAATITSQSANLPNQANASPGPHTIWIGGASLTLNIGSTQLGDFNSPVTFKWTSPTSMRSLQASNNSNYFAYQVGSTSYNLRADQIYGNVLTLTDHIGGTTATRVFDFSAMSLSEMQTAVSNANSDPNHVLIWHLNPKGGAPVSYDAASGRPRNTAFTITDYYQDYYSTWNAIPYLRSLIASTSITLGTATALNFEVTSASGGNVAFNVTGMTWGVGGNGTGTSAGPATLTLNDTTGGSIVLGGQTISFNALGAGNSARFRVGDKFSTFQSDATGADTGITVTGSDGSRLTYNFIKDKIKNQSFSLTRYGYNWQGSMTNPPGSASLYGVTVAVPWNFENVHIGDIAKTYTKFHDLERFWNSEGRFLLDDPKTITITQGDGKQARVTLYADDTVQNFVDKLNRAIGEDLGQARYYTALPPRFAVYVSSATGVATSVAGTVVLSSIIPGAEGRLTFSGDEEIIQALGLSVIRPATESAYTVKVEDAHTGVVVVSPRKVTGNKLIGDIHPNVDLVFDPMSGVVVSYISATGYFQFSAGTAAVTYLHLKDNTTVLQIGANEGEDMGLHIGDTRAYALGLNRVLVVSRATAARSITLIDNAIDRVSTLRARLGAYQNRLEHTINNLTVAGQNLTASESRIRDTDMAKEMMSFTKFQILLQAGVSMVAQANALPQNILTLLR
ncbi:MAG: flagellin [Synergistaceae bacterium]|nr:flagellin [Synergistaceae bacterium]